MIFSADELVSFVNGVFLAVCADWRHVYGRAHLWLEVSAGSISGSVNAIIAWVIFPLLPPIPIVSAFSVHGMLITIQQVVIGVAMGFTLQMVFLRYGGCRSNHGDQHGPWDLPPRSTRKTGFRCRSLVSTS